MNALFTAVAENAHPRLIQINLAMRARQALQRHAWTEMALDTPDAAREAIIRRHTVTAGGVAVLDLEVNDDNGQTLPAFEAGAHIELLLESGSRHYSICSPPGNTSFYRLAVLREAEGRGGSQEVHENFRVGSKISFLGPFNHFPLSAGVSAPIFIAGGIGITPIVSMAHECLRNDRDFELHYAARSPEAPILAEIGADHAEMAARTRLYISSLGQRLELSEILVTKHAQRPIYVCGPKRLIDAVYSIARENGWHDNDIHFEHFQGGEPELDPENDSFQVKINSTSQVVDVAPEQTVAEALTAAGINIPTSCCSGVCGSCRTRILEGVPDHKDLFYSDEQRTQGDEFTPCCSRSKSPLLVLDL